MEEIVYIVTRDSAVYECDVSDACVAVWEFWRDIGVNKEDPACGDFWEDKDGEMPTYEFTPEEFESAFCMKPPEPEQKFLIRTDCVWEKVKDV